MAYGNGKLTPSNVNSKTSWYQLSGGSPLQRPMVHGRLLEHGSGILLALAALLQLSMPPQPTARDPVELSERAPQALKHHLLTGVGMARHALKRDGSTGACVRRELMASPSHGEPSSHAAALCISCRRGNTAALESALFLQEVASLSFEHRLAALRHRRVMFRRLAACRRSPHCCAGVFCSSLKTSSRPGRTSGMTAGRAGLTWGSSMRAQNTPAGFTWARRSTCCCAPEGAAAGPAARGRPSRG